MFLVEFGPNKHGDYQDSQYQETQIYDIISWTDALRHPVVPGDRVLAPNSKGKYAPALVIEGMEHRTANQSEHDSLRLNSESCFKTFR